MVLRRQHNPATTTAAVAWMVSMRGGADAAGVDNEDIRDPIQRQQQLLDPESDNYDMTSSSLSDGNSMFLRRGRTTVDNAVGDDKSTSSAPQRPLRQAKLISLREDNHGTSRRRRTTPQQGGGSSIATTTTITDSNNNVADQRTDPAAFVVVGKQGHHHQRPSMPWKYTPEQLHSRLQQQQQQQQQLHHIPRHGNDNHGEQPSQLRTVGNNNDDDNYLKTALYPSLQPRNALWRILTSIFASLFGWVHRSATTTPASVVELHVNNINDFVHPRLISLVQLYAWSLIGSSVGFYSFLYFISVGHALGIFFPVGATLTRYVHRCITTKSITTFSLASILHSIMVLAWAIRLCVFLLWREYSSWPALHFKILQVQALLPHKFVCWFLYSLVYVCMMSPCWFRLEADLLLTTGTPSVMSWVKKATSTILTVTGIVGQFLGLTIESIADYQKSQFKAVPGQRNAWCHTGLWQYSTHPNYAGEWIFWIGTIVAALPSIVQLSMGSTNASKARLTGVLHLLLRGGVVGIGFVFLTTILSGAIQLQQQRQQTKYGSDPYYCDFIARTSVFGPFRQRQRLDLDDNEAQTTNISTMEDSPLLLAENADDVAT